ncbi:MAG: hypothetical protein GY738_00095, partial [Pseudoalteromonas sp.]|nr:hypothetical protein [Pseudoalteromonas sp.]
MSDIAHLGFSVDTKGLQKGGKALDNFAVKGEQAESRTTSSMKKSEKSMAAFGRSSGQAGIQFQQFIGQVQGGASPMLALSQQSADLGIVLGAPLLGAIAGISASLIGILLPSLMKNQDSMKIIEQIAIDMGASLSKSSEGVDELSQSLIKLSEKSEALAKLQISVSVKDAEKQIKAAASGIEQALDDAFGMTTESALRSFSEGIRYAAVHSTGSMEDVVKALATGETALLAFGKNSNAIKDTVNVLARNFKITKSQAVEMALSISDVFNEQSVFNIKKLENTLTDLNVETGGASEELIKLSRVLIPLFDATTDGVDKTNLLRQAFGDFGQQAIKVDEDLKRFNDNVNGISASLEGQIIALRDGEAASTLYSIAQRLELDSMSGIPQSIRDQVTEYEKLKKAKEDIIKAERKKSKKAASERRQAADLKALTNSVNNFGGAWSRTGNIIVDSFGSMSDAMGDYSQRMSELGELEDRIATKRADGSATNAELSALQMQVNSERVSAELSGLSALSSATGAMFSEKSKASKAFAALNKVIAIAEIAMSFKKMAAGTAETGVHVANETTKQSANALTAITGAFAAPFPVGFIAGAAMIGVMASLLGSSKSGGNFTDPTESRQDTQGTGSMLGSDDKSSSILDSQERFEDIQLSQLSELRGIRSSMTNLANGIAQVTKGLMASADFGEYSGSLESSNGSAAKIMGSIDKVIGGDFAGIGEKIMGSLFGSSKSKVTDTGIKFVATSLSDILDGGIVDAQQYFDVTKTKKKLFGAIKKVSTSTSFEDIDSDFADQVGSIFKDIGSAISKSTGLLGFDVESALNAFQIDLGSISLEGLSGKEIEEQLQAIFSRQADLITGAALPDLKEFQKVGEGLFETLGRVTQEQMIFNDVTRSMGMNLNELSSIMQIEVAQSVIELTGGLEQFSELSNAFVNKFYSDAEKFAMLESDLGDVFNTVGHGMVTTREEFRALVEGLDLTNAAQREVYATLLEVSPAFDEYVKGLEKVKEGLEDAVLNSFGKLEQAIKLQKNGAQAALDVAQEAHNAELDRI